MYAYFSVRYLTEGAKSLCLTGIIQYHIYTYYTPEASCPILNPITLYIHVHWYVTPKKNHQKIQRLKCKNKKNASSSPKDVIYSLVLTAIQI